MFWYASSLEAKGVKENKEIKEKEHNKTFFFYLFILKSIKKHIRIIFMM